MSPSNVRLDQAATDHSRFIAPAKLIALLTASSRILGLARECAFSYFFGVHPLFSSFRVAFMIPNLSRRLFGEGAMSSAFIPVFTEVLHHQSRDRARQLAGSALTLLGTVLIGLTVAIELGITIADLIRPTATLELTRVMMPYMILICLTAFAGGMLNSLNHFGAPAAAPMLLNVFIIVAVWAGSRLAGLAGLPLLYVISGSVVAAGVAQLGLQLLALRRLNCHPQLNLRWGDTDLRRIMVMMGPMLIGLSATQLNILADSVIALTLVPNGRGPAVLGYAHMLYNLPLGVFGIALATAIFPLLSSKAAQNDLPGLARVLERGLRMSIFISLPAAVGLILLAEPIVSLLYQRGQFDETAAGHVRRTLMFYCLGLVAYSTQHIVIRAFYAIKNTRTPMRIGAIVVSLNITLNLILVFPLAEGGLALATAICATIQTIWLTHRLRRQLSEGFGLGSGFRWRFVAAGTLQAALATGAMAVIVWWLSRMEGLSQQGDLIQLAVTIPAGVAIYILAARALRCQELNDLLGKTGTKNQG